MQLCDIVDMILLKLAESSMKVSKKVSQPYKSKMILYNDKLSQFWSDFLTKYLLLY